MSDMAKAALERALPAYEIGERLGEGAFGVVYAATHTQLGRAVAIKQLPKVYAEDPSVSERFLAEAQMVASLDHPHIVPVYDFVENEGSRYLIMERCAGSIADKFRDDGIATDEACAAVLACLAGLDTSHTRGLLHRDVKPENLMFDAHGVVKLADFGIARDTGTDTRRTATGMIVGTPAYMSPEQCRGDELTPATDVYSVGMMAYELLTGGLPFPNSDSVNGLLAHHLVTEPRPLLQARPELPGSIGEVIDRSLSKDLSVRHSSAAEMARDLARACVQAFGSGWLRRRRFVLHWPEIIAETERPSDASPRTGTIMVRAGDLTHEFTEPSPPSPVPAPAPVHVAAVASSDDIDQPSPTPVSTPPPSTDTSSGKPPWALIGVVGLALAAVIAGLIALMGGDDPGEIAVEIPTPTAIVADDSATDADADATTDPSTDESGDSTAAATPVATLEASSDDADTDDTSDTGAATSADNQTSPTGPTPPPVNYDSSGNLRFEPTEAPEGIDLTDIFYPGSPRPCPTDQERVACIWAATADSDTDEITVTYWVEGFLPEVESDDHHLHFYIDSEVDGDETKAGSETPGGTWRVWDTPWPATSFGGENGRTMFTFTEFRSVKGRNLCVLVADSEHRAIRGSGNCVTLYATAGTFADDDASPDDIELDDLYDARFLSLLDEGQYAGTCGLGVTAGIPDSWRWFDLTDDLGETARRIRPTAPADAENTLSELVDLGGVIYSDGPAGPEGVVPTSTYSLWPGDFTINDDADEVRATLDQLGVDTSSSTVRSIADRNIIVLLDDLGDTVSMTYVVPDFSYAIAMNFIAPGGSDNQELADKMAATVLGC